ncbi:MAG: cyclic nucleotide-binding domain-containing protein [Bdellovibrionales bacterium]|nr:cyclic nucleotide-binding domain-containing protein [Bdellovibrionales bacterium]
MINFMWDNLFRKSDEQQEVAEALRQTFVFQPLSRKELGFVQDTVHVRVFKPGEVIFRQGEIGVGMYIILRGALDIYIDHAMEEDVPPRAHMVTRLRAGDFLGELSLVENNSRRTATAIAAEESLLIGFFKPDLFEILERQPATGVKILLRLSEVLGRRLKETTMKVTELKEEIRRMNEKV